MNQNEICEMFHVELFALEAHKFFI